MRKKKIESERVFMTMPQSLYRNVQDKIEIAGYPTIQELIRDLLRKWVATNNYE